MRTATTMTKPKPRLVRSVRRPVSRDRSPRRAAVRDRRVMRSVESCAGGDGGKAGRIRGGIVPYDPKTPGDAALADAMPDDDPSSPVVGPSAPARSETEHLPCG